MSETAADSKPLPIAEEENKIPAPNSSREKSPSDEGNLAVKRKADDENDTSAVIAAEAAPSSEPDVNSSAKRSCLEASNEKLTPSEEGDKEEKDSKAAAEDSKDEAAVDNNRPLDLATTLGYKPGDRFEVKWFIETAEGTDTTHWWGCTLLPADDTRTKDGVAIRTLEYDPYVEGGFPEKSLEDAIFIGPAVMANPETCEELPYRLEGGDDTAAVWYSRNDVEGIVNATLEQAMAKNSKAWSKMTAAQQTVIAGVVADKKEKLLDLLLSHPNAVITSEDMKSILGKIMEQR